MATELSLVSGKNLPGGGAMMSIFSPPLQGNAQLQGHVVYPNQHSPGRWVCVRFLRLVDRLFQQRLVLEDQGEGDLS
jgi:hypothetical protein